MRRKQTQLKIGVILDPIETLTFTRDSSVLMMAEACERQHQVYYCSDQQLTYHRGQLLGHMRTVQALRQDPYLIPGKMQLMSLADLDVVLIRKDPPFDASYLYLTQLLDLIADKVLVINSPAGLRNANEKLFILNFPEWIAPTLVTSQLSDAEHFFRQQNEKIILKPLHLYSGHGIERATSLSQLRKLMRRMTMPRMAMTGKVPIMLQKYLRIEKGDKRVNLIHGKPIGTLLRLPKANEYRSNLLFGGQAVATTITRRDHAIAEALAPRLRREGLELVGLDVIDGYLTEVNVTSPTGYPSMNRLGNLRLEAHVLDFIEKRCR